MKRFFAALFSLGFVLVALASFWLMEAIKQPGPFNTEQDVVIEPKTTGYGIAQKLASDHLIDHPQVFYALMRLKPFTVKAGEYALPPHASPYDILALLHEGKIIERGDHQSLLAQDGWYASQWQYQQLEESLNAL